MPKELVHWWVAAEALKRLPNGSRTAAMLSARQHDYLIGAVLPDTLLHLLRGVHSAAALRQADLFHNPREGSSYAPLLRCAAACSGTIAPDVSASLLGIASHMEADIVFHPFVYARSGADIGLHYRIETELDLWLLHGGFVPPAMRLDELLTAESAAVAASTASSVFDPDGKLEREAFPLALSAHRRIQAMYGSLFWFLAARLLAIPPGSPVRAWRWLFYPPGWRRGRDFNWPASWIEPATGIERTENTEQLLEMAVGRVWHLLEAVDRTGLVEALRSRTGENLLTGRPPAA